jgi:hypothetical protein
MNLIQIKQIDGLQASLNSLAASQYDLDQSVSGSMEQFDDFWYQADWSNSQVQFTSDGDSFEGEEGVTLAIPNGSFFVREGLICQGPSSLNVVSYLDGNNDTKTLKGSIFPKYESTNSSLGLSEDSYIVGVDTISASAAVVISLPTGDARFAGKEIFIKDEGFNASTYNIEIDAIDANIENSTTQSVITGDGGHLKLYTNGSNWFYSSENGVFSPA